MNWTQKTPSYGDIIRVKVNFYHHYGIYVSDSEIIQFGLPDNSGTPSEKICVMTTDIDVFANGGFTETAELDHAEKHKRRRPEDAVKIATSRIGETGYNILNNNCEHFVNDCVFGEPKSFLDEVREKIRERIHQNINKK